MKTENRGICGLCGKRPGTTQDHIPPKCIFPTPRPNNLITIRTCEECNRNTSQSDEEFRVFINLFVGKTTCEAERLWKSHTLSTVRSNRRLLEKALESFQLGFVTSKHGIILGESKLVVWDDSINGVLEKMVRGLYFHHFGEVLGDRVQVRISQVGNTPETLADDIKSWAYNSVGGDQFIYRYARANDVPLRSAWLFIFHKSLMILGDTVPAHDSSVSV